MNTCEPSFAERTDSSLPITALNAIVTSVGWDERSEAQWTTILERSKYIYSLWDGERIVGLGRVLEDGYMAMFYDIAVHPDYQGRGIGTQVMRHLMEQLRDKNYCVIALFAWAENPAVVEFYKKLEFVQVPFGMKWHPASRA